MIIERDYLKENIIKLERKFFRNSPINKNIECNSKGSKGNNVIINIETPYTKRKRKRRKQKDIIKNFSCYFSNCNKSYPTKSSLNIHIKLKHSEKNS